MEQNGYEKLDKKAMKKWDKAMKKKRGQNCNEKGVQKVDENGKNCKNDEKDGNAIKRSKYDEKRGQKK